MVEEAEGAKRQVNQVEVNLLLGPAGGQDVTHFNHRITQDEIPGTLLLLLLLLFLLLLLMYSEKQKPPAAAPTR